MSELWSPSNVQMRASRGRPAWSNSEARRNTGSVQPVQPVQPFLENNKEKFIPLSCERGQQYFPESFCENTLDAAGRLDRTLFFNGLEKTYVGRTLDGNPQRMKGIKMYDLQPTTEYEWKETANGNFVGIYDDEFVATVFSKAGGGVWQIIINGDGVGRIVAEEAFADPDDAMERAEEVLAGADCTLVVLKPNASPGTTDWKQQKTVANGAPTFGRKQDGVGVSVKKAKSGSWFYNVHGSAPQGWYDSAEGAMQAFDAEHG